MSPEHLTAGELAYELACWKDIENQETSWAPARIQFIDHVFSTATVAGGTFWYFLVKLSGCPVTVFIFILMFYFSNLLFGIIL